METLTINNPKENRKFLPKDLVIDSWEKLEKYFEALLHEEINSKEDLKAWLKKLSELEAVVEEDAGWRYIRMTTDTANEAYSKAYSFFVEKISPQLSSYSNKLDKKLLECPFTEELTKEEEAYYVYIRGVKKQVEIFREENIPLKTEEQLKQKKYNEIIGAMTVEIDGQELPLPKAAVKLQDKDRSVRESAFHKINERRLQDTKKLDDLFDELVQLRHQIAVNAGFANYRDYKFAALGRFDYSVEDCFEFHNSVKKEVVPLINQFYEKKKQYLGVSELRPWDTAADFFGKEPLKPFDQAEELIHKTISCFSNINPFYAKCIKTMDEIGHLDLESRKGKAPGGYNYPLYDTGVPFIFMNAAGTVNDLITMVHEGGHAIHSFLMQDLELTPFKGTPSEVAELASMSMEWISMEHWDVFFPDKEELRRAKIEQFDRSLSVLPWIAIVDKFQHWIYTNPEHTAEERTKAWTDISKEFEVEVIDWSGLEQVFSKRWQKQLHIYEVPFYYIEYGIAELGAIGMWQQYKLSPQQALNNYESALKLGYTRTIPHIFEAGGLNFNFSRENIQKLSGFVNEEMKKLF